MGDGESSAGLFELQQPTIRLLWDSRQAQQSLIAFAVAAGHADWATTPIEAPKNPAKAVAGRQVLWDPAVAGVRSWHGMVRQAWDSVVRPASRSVAEPDAFWKAALGTGFVAVAQKSSVSAPSFAASGFAASTAVATVDAPFELWATASRTLGDGSMGNNAWLQEVPDAVSKVCWDPWLAMSISDANKLGLHQDDVVTLSLKITGGADGAAQSAVSDVQVPVLVQPGMRAGNLELMMGFRPHSRWHCCRRWRCRRAAS